MAIVFWKDSMDFARIIQHKEEVLPLKEPTVARVAEKKPQNYSIRDQSRR